MKGIESIKASGKEVVFTLKEANADLPYLLSDYHLIVQPNGGKDNADAGIGTGPYKVSRQRARRAPRRRALRQLLAGRQAGPCRPGRDHRHQRRDGAHLGAAGRPGQHDQPRRAEDRRPDQARAGRHDPQRAGPGHYVFIMHCNTRALRQQRSADGAETRDGPRGDAGQDPAGLRLARQRLPDQHVLSAVLRRHRAAQVRSRQGGSSTTRSRATAGRSCCAPPTSPSPARSMPPSSTSRARRRPASPSRSSASRATATGRKSGTSSPSRPPTGAAARPRTRCIRPPTISTADWNDTRFLRQDFDKMLLAARAELDQAKRKADLSRHGRDRARRRRPDPADVQRLHRRDRPEGRRLGRRSAPGADERLRAVRSAGSKPEPAVRRCRRPS